MKTKKGNLTIIDADGLLFYAGWHYRDQLTNLGLMGAKSRLDKMIAGLLDKSHATHYLGFYGLHGAKNFRYNWATLRPYKGNRTSPPWQEYFKPHLKDHFRDKWGFHGMEKIEADDAVTIAHHQFKEDWNIVHVSEDKDAAQLGEFDRLNPSNKANPMKKIEHMDHITGRKFFWAQNLMGDSTDNIQGVEGIGKANARVKELLSMENPTEEEMFQFVRTQYIKKYGDNWLYYMMENYMLLKMREEPCFDYPEKPNIVEWRKKEEKSNIKLIDL